ncbi:hypothetical protein HK098_003325 [Nowakowskiella sp. JEL0407]|nr:hypothetical protein HK098_003325 [Nowakowskiella sp. JEL0407]
MNPVFEVSRLVVLFDVTFCLLGLVPVMRKYYGSMITRADTPLTGRTWIMIVVIIVVVYFLGPISSIQYVFVYAIGVVASKHSILGRISKSDPVLGLLVGCILFVVNTVQRRKDVEYLMNRGESVVPVIDELLDKSFPMIFFCWMWVYFLHRFDKDETGSGDESKRPKIFVYFIYLGGVVLFAMSLWVWNVAKPDLFIVNSGIVVGVVWGLGTLMKIIPGIEEYL